VDRRDGLVVTGAVSLTAALMDALDRDESSGERLPSLEKDHVVAYLTRHLHWRVALGCLGCFCASHLSR